MVKASRQKAYCFPRQWMAEARASSPSISAAASLYATNARSLTPIARHQYVMCWKPVNSVVVSEAGTSSQSLQGERSCFSEAMAQANNVAPAVLFHLYECSCRVKSPAGFRNGTDGI